MKKRIICIVAAISVIAVSATDIRRWIYAGKKTGKKTVDNTPRRMYNAFCALRRRGIALIAQ